MAKFGQVNAQGAFIVMAELGEIAERRGLQQHPYIVNGDLPGFSGWKKFYLSADSMSVILCRREMNTVFLRQASDTHHVVVQLTIGDESLYVVSSYFQYRDPTEDHLRKWDGILRLVGASPVIIGADLNSKSLLWHSGVTDVGGEMVEGFIAQHNFEVFNRVGQPATYVGMVDGRRGFEGTNIDVTFGRYVHGMVTDWVVVDDCASDHRLILFDVISRQRNEPLRQTYLQKGRFLHRKADWPRFSRLLGVELSGIVLRLINEYELDDLAERYTQAIITAAEASIPRSEGRERVARWWTQALTARKASEGSTTRT